MIWTIDTGVRGPIGCTDSDDLRAVLEDNMHHVGRTAAEAAAAAVMRQVNPEELKDPTKITVLHERSLKARKQVEAKFPIIQEQMKAGIDAACALMKSMNCPCTVTITGHLSLSHPSGVENRLQVSVDKVLPHEPLEEAEL